MIRIVLDKTAQAFTFETEGRDRADEILGKIVIELDKDTDCPIRLSYKDRGGSFHEVRAKEIHVVIKELQETKEEEKDNGRSEAIDGNEEEGGNRLDS